MTASTPTAWRIWAMPDDDTTHTGMPPPLSTYCAAYAPMPPVAPQINTTSPHFIAAPLRDTSMRELVELHSALTAASSHVRWAGLGSSWLTLTTARSARPPKLVS